jgi:glycosyl transferase family 25
VTLREATYVINLPHRRDRRAETKRQLRRIGWNAEFVAAVRPSEPDGFPSIGARGCFLSHLDVLKRALDAGLARVVILEDDLNFCDTFPEQWPAAMAMLDDAPWSILYPGHLLSGLPDGLSRLPPSTAVQCTHFMMLNGPAIAEVVAGLEAILARPPGHPLGGPMHVDGAYSTIRLQNPALATYAISPALGYQRPSRTDIGDRKWFDRIPMLERPVNFARRWKLRL